MAKRPIVETGIRTEFGDVQDDPSFYDVGGADRDLTYVPGFSDLKRARDLELAAVASGRKPRHEARILPLPVNVRWTRTTTPKGAPDGMKQITTANLGYKPAHKDQIGKVDWLKELPPGATINADGSIQKGDTILMVADGKTAARNAARKQAQTQRMTDPASVGAAAGGLLGVRGNGADPYVKKET
jgi:hypothetical protein